MLKEAYDEAKRLLNENREVMDRIAEFLIQKETITGKEFMRIYRQVKGIPEPPEEIKQGVSRLDASEPETAKPDEPILMPGPVQEPEQQNLDIRDEMKPI